MENEAMEDLGYRSKFKKPREEDTKTQRLCKKHGVTSEESALMLEQGHQAVLGIVKRPGALEAMPKTSKTYFAQKIEFEEMWKRGEINSLWDYYMTKDEMMRCYRNNTSFGRWKYNEKEHHWDLIK